MILTKTSQYAIQTLVLIAIQKNTLPVLVRVAARTLDISPTYLAKILQHLCQAGIVNSYRGRLGGFRLVQIPEQTSLMQIIQIFEGDAFIKNCVLGLKVCSDETACPMHGRWKPIKESIKEVLNSQTLATLRDAVIEGKYRICDINGCVICAAT